MLDKEFIELSQMQLSRAEELLTEAAALISFGAYNSSVNRAYYAAFHAMKAVEALDNFDSKRHSGVIQHFRQTYIKTGVFELSLSGMIDRLQNARGDSDYNITVRFTSEDSAGYLKEAEIIVSAIREYLQTKYVESAKS